MKSELLKAGIFLSFAVSLMLGKMRPKDTYYTLSALFVSGFIFFSPELHLKLLGWFAGVWLSYFIATSNGKRSESKEIQKYFMLNAACALVGIFGAALAGVQGHLLLVFFSVLFAMPTSIMSLVFYRVFSSLKPHAYLVSVVLPSLMGIDILYSLKNEVTREYALLFQMTLVAYGVSGILVASYFSMIEKRLKNKLIMTTQAWLAMMLLLLSCDSSLVLMALSAVSVALILIPVLFLESRKVKKQNLLLALVVIVCFPFCIGFNVFYFSMKVLSGSYLVLGPIVFLIFILFQSAAFVLEISKDESKVEAVSTRFILIIATGIVSSAMLYFLGAHYALG